MKIIKINFENRLEDDDYYTYLTPRYFWAQDCWSYTTWNEMLSNGAIRYLYNEEDVWGSLDEIHFMEFASLYGLTEVKFEDEYDVYLDYEDNE